MYPLFETSFFSNFQLNSSCETLCSARRRPCGSVQLRRCEHVVDAHPQHHN